jgi:hypothetical protein
MSPLSDLAARRLCDVGQRPVEGDQLIHTAAAHSELPLVSSHPVGRGLITSVDLADSPWLPRCFSPCHPVIIDSEVADPEDLLIFGDFCEAGPREDNGPCCARSLLDGDHFPVCRCDRCVDQRPVEEGDQLLHTATAHTELPFPSGHLVGRGVITPVDCTNSPLVQR